MKDKIQLRKELLAKREQLPKSEKSLFDALIVERFLQSDLFLNSTTVFIYLNFRSEPETLQLAAFMKSTGKRVCVPYIENAAEGKMTAREFLNFDSVQPGEYGILTVPSSNAEIAPADIDCAVAPGAVFDRKGNRAGYGGGFYDRFFNQLNSRCVKAAFAYDFQIIDKLNSEEHDQPVDELFTERERYVFKESK